MKDRPNKSQYIIPFLFADDSNSMKESRFSLNFLKEEFIEISSRYAENKLLLTPSMTQFVTFASCENIVFLGQKFILESKKNLYLGVNIDRKLIFKLTKLS